MHNKEELRFRSRTDLLVTREVLDKQGLSNFCSAIDQRILLIDSTETNKVEDALSANKLTGSANKSPRPSLTGPRTP